MKRLICLIAFFLLMLSLSLTSCMVGGSTLTFVSYGAYDPQQVSYNNGQTISSLPVMNKIGFEFVGWATKENSTEVLYVPFTAGITDLTLYGVYKIDYDMFFDNNIVNDSADFVEPYSYSNCILLKNNKEATSITIDAQPDVIKNVIFTNCNGKTLEYAKNGNAYTIEKTVGDIVIDIELTSYQGQKLLFTIT